MFGRRLSHAADFKSTAKTVIVINRGLADCAELRRTSNEKLEMLARELVLIEMHVGICVGETPEKRSSLFPAGDR